MGKHSDYSASNVSGITQKFLEGSWQIIFKALQAWG